MTPAEPDSRVPAWRRRPRLLLAVAVSLLVVVLVVAGVLWTGLRRSEPPPVGPGHRLVFEDDFDGDRLDSTKWTDRRGVAPHTYGSPFNPQLEDTLFEPEQVGVEDGALRLSATPRRVQDELGGATYGFVSGVVHTGAHFAYTYGYAEARILVPDDAGYWPAFWMLPTPVDDQWPPEIDIAEFSAALGSTTRPTFNVHWRDAYGEQRQLGPTPYGDPNTSYAGSWHTYGLSWEPGRLQVYLDGQPGPVFAGQDVPDQPMYLVLGMGVARGANPAPAAMTVDYVRVWSDTTSG